LNYRKGGKKPKEEKERKLGVHLDAIYQKRKKGGRRGGGNGNIVTKTSFERKI